MKTPDLQFAFLSLLMVVSSCDENPEAVHQKLAINFTVVSSDKINLHEIPPGARLVINVQSPNGDPVLDYEEVKFQFRQNQFLIESRDLSFGNYILTDLILLDDNDDIIYAAPKASSELATTVATPLDHKFTVGSSAIPLGMDFQLLEARGHKASDFGYASFKKPGRSEKLNVSVFLQRERDPTTARASVVNGTDTLRHYNLLAKVNRITMPSGLNETHKLVIFKSGYAPVSYPLTDLLRTQKNKTLKVTLVPALTMLAYVDFQSLSMFSFEVAAPEGSSITVDWGEGTVESYELSGQSAVMHAYSQDGNYPITVTGDLDKISFFYSFYGQAMMDAVNFQHLSNLEEIRFGLTRSPKVLDLSHNTMLNFVMLSGLMNLAVLYLPASHNITTLLVEGPNKLTTSDVDGLIENIYQNASGKNLVNGVFGIAADWSQPEGVENLVGPPSASAMTELQSLKNNYGWTIYPDPFD